MMAWQPFEILNHLSKTSVLIIISENDTISPADKQEVSLNGLQAPKTAYITKWKGNLDAPGGVDYEILAQMQTNFIKGP